MTEIATRPLESIAVVGLGLIGGSLARDLSESGVRVLGFDRDDRTMRDARDEGVVHASLGERLEGLHEADAIVLALPVDAMARALRDVASVASSDALITDVGSTKRSVIAAAESLGLAPRFVGAHPLAGDHRSGWIASRRGLFAGARVFLCPASGATSSAIEQCGSMWERVGARPERVDATTHDRTLAWTSHLPHLLSAALAGALDEAQLERSDLGPGGRGMTRLAGGAPELWTAIARDNATSLDLALRDVERQLQTIRAALASDGPAALLAALTRARDWCAREEHAAPTTPDREASARRA